jgi:GH25 family lysozyme M1 (1,4-beta-N-acetylmuramidase)
VDVEDNPFYDGAWNPANNAAYLAAVERWVEAVRTRTGADPVLYTRAGFWDELGNPKMFRTCPLWVASYRPNAPRLPATWDRYTFWQYSEAGEVDGIASKVDLNYFAGGKDALDALLLGARTAAPARAQARRRQERRPPPSA